MFGVSIALPPGCHHICHGKTEPGHHKCPKIQKKGNNQLSKPIEREISVLGLTPTCIEREKFFPTQS